MIVVLFVFTHIKKGRYDTTETSITTAFKQQYNNGLTIASNKVRNNNPGSLCHLYAAISQTSV